MDSSLYSDWMQDPLWYKDAIIYQLHVKAFFDSNNDGTGDFRGLTQKLDYIKDLGVNAIWLLPFYPSPMRDDGYDIADYRNIHPDYGSRKDFKQFVREAHRRGLKVITELVINHTSDQHPWFQAARHAPPHSAKRNYYVWSKTKHKFPETRIIFTDTESSNWAWDEVAGAYYWHRFFSHQPDLNHNNPEVVKAVIRVMRFWLDMGVDGLRLDAIPYLCVREGTNNENLPETHEVIREMRRVVDAHYDSRLFLAEANQWPEDVRDYFGDGDECHMAYHFPLMPRMYMAIAQEDRHPIVEIMRQTPEIPANCQWAIFLRNHDELTLEMVTDRERDYMYEAYAADLRARVNVGIRRRLAPLMDNDPDKIKLMNSLLMSMPGSPIVYYGDEIGMGDNIYLGDRNGVRTPMQWTPDRNAGFSRADPQRLYLPPIMDPIYGHHAVNVEAQSRDAASLLNWMKRLIAVRKSHRAFGRGSLEFLRPGNRKILAYLREHDGESVLCVANLSHTAQPVELDLSRFKGRVPLEVMGLTPFPPIGDLPYLLTLSPHGVYWFVLAQEAEVPSWHEEHLPPPDLPVLVLANNWSSFDPAQIDGPRRKTAEELRRALEHEALPNFLPGQRWYAGKGVPIDRVELEVTGEWVTAEGNWLFTWIRVISANAAQTYFLPLTFVWEEREEDIWPRLHYTVAKVRRRANVGLLCDALSDGTFCHALVSAFARSDRLAFGDGAIHFDPTSAYADLAEADRTSTGWISRPAGEGSNTTVVIDDRLFLKIYRRIQEGHNPELEIGRFLTEKTRFRNAIPVAGTIEYQPADGGEPVSLGLLQAYVENQGDGWRFTLDYLERYLEECRVKPAEEIAAEGVDLHGVDLLMMHTLGTRTGDLHQALATRTGDPAFDPEVIAVEEFTAIKAQVQADILNIFRRLETETLPDAMQGLIALALAVKPRILDRLTRVDAAALHTLKTRTHGDYHLGQVLVVENDFYIIDFEGEPSRPLNERRIKQSPARDVAGMLRSFSYAAYSTLYRLSADRPEDFELLEPFARDWERKATAAFLTGYERAVRSCAVYPSEPDQARYLLELFTLEKLVYELGYELDNRPDWLRIPLRGLLALVQDE